MFLVNSRLGLFSAACSRRLPFSLGYGVILPSSLTTVLSLALGFSPHLPVSVCGTGTLVLLEAFPGSLNDSASLLYFHSPSQITIVLPDLPGLTRFLLGHALPTACSGHPPASPLRSINYGGTGFITRCPSPTPFGLGLGPDLPWADEPSSGNLRFSAGRILTFLSLLMPTFSLVYGPLFLSILLHPVYDALLPLYSTV